MSIAESVFCVEAKDACATSTFYRGTFGRRTVSTAPILPDQAGTSFAAEATPQRDVGERFRLLRC